MQNRENVNRVIQNAISDNIGRSRYNQFTRAADAAHSSGVGHAGSLPDGKPNARDHLDGSGRVIVRDVIKDLVELLDS